MRTDQLWQEVIVAARNTVRRPGFAVLVVVTLAVGLGINAAIFAIVDAVLLRPLPYRQPERLVFVWQTLPQHNVFDIEATPADYAAWHSLKSFSSLAMVATDTHTLTGDVEPERVRGARLTASVFGLLGIAPSLGRPFVPAEDTSGTNPVAMLGDGLWRRRYGADPGVIGRSVQIDGVPHTIVGVLPPSATLPGPLAANSDLWLAARMSAEERTNDISHNYTVIGRLADGVTVGQANSEVAAFPTADAVRDRRASSELGARVQRIADATVAQIRPALIALLAAICVLLVTAAANVTTLVISRRVSRSHDLAVRAALGASRATLLRHTSAEMLLLTLSGAVIGLATGAGLLRIFVPMFRESLPVTAVPPQIDGRIATITFALALLLGIAYGLVALRGDHETAAKGGASPYESLRAGRRMSATRDAARTRNALVVVQVAFAVVLLAAAGLLVRSIVRLRHVNAGFTADRVLTFRLALDAGGYQSSATRASFVQALTREIAARPGIAGAAVTSRIPFGGARGASAVDIEGRTPARGESVIIDQRHITSDYFRVMQIPLLAGRTFSDADDARAEPVAIVNKTMADRYWPGTSPIDHRVRLTAGFDSGQWIRIVGVIGDVHHVAMSRAPVPEMYRPYSQAPAPEFTVVAGTSGDPAGAAGVCRRAVQALDRNLPVYDLRTMDDRVAASLAQTRATTLLLAMTAGVAAMLAAIAIYGSIWYSVAQRTAEIGIRMALGATRSAIAARIVATALVLTAGGAVVGLAGVAAAKPLITGLLFETGGTDPTTLVLVICAMLAFAAAASAAPARRATKVDPLGALRCE